MVVVVSAAVGRGQTVERTPPQTGDMTRSQGQRTTAGLVRLSETFVSTLFKTAKLSFNRFWLLLLDERR